jgi:carbon monoxide dehydrogenase subunit G
MTEIRKTIDVNVPQEEVFTLLTDLDRLPDWSTITVATHDAPAQPISKGDTFRQSLRVVGRQLDTDWTVTELDRPRHVAHEAKGPAGARLRMAQTVEPSGGGCRVSFEVDYELPGGGVGDLASPLIERRNERGVEHSLQNLKEVAEHR